MQICFLYIADDYEVIGEAQWQILENVVDEEIFKIYGFKYSKWNSIIFHIICIVLCGLPYVAMAYYPSYNRFKYLKCSLKMAELICGKFIYIIHKPSH